METWALEFRLFEMPIIYLAPIIITKGRISEETPYKGLLLYLSYASF